MTSNRESTSSTVSGEHAIKDEKLEYTASSDESVNHYAHSTNGTPVVRKRTNSNVSQVSYRTYRDEVEPQADLVFDAPEVQIALERTESRIQPDYSDINEEDPYQYPLDKESGFRIVTFVGQNDRDDPRTMSKLRKWIITVMLGIVCFDVALASSIVTGNLDTVAEYFDTSEEVIILTVTLFVVGFGVGPIVFAPASEEWGRRVVYIATFAAANAFILPCALAKNVATLLIGRLLDGIAFSAPMSLIGGSLADIWRTEERGIAMCVFSAAPFIGPAVGPLVGGFIGDYLYWRWIYWITLIFTGAVTIAMVLIVPETHHNTILKARCKKLVKLTGDTRYRTVKDLNPTKLKEMVTVVLIRPVILLKEPIVLFMTLYMTVLYGLLYMFFLAYPVVYMEGKGWSAHETGLMFIPLGLGIILAGACAPFVNMDFLKRRQAYLDRGELCPPEVRLYPMMFGCWFIPIGLFIFGWTSYENVSWWGPAMGGFPVGFGFIFLYNAANNYLIDTYVHYAASVLATKTMVRSFWGAAVVLFTVQMYHRLGNQWASSLLAFIALACCAIPFVFFFFGKKIRSRSQFAYDYANEAPM